MYFTSAMALYHCCCDSLLSLLLFMVVTSWTSATACFGHQFHQKYFAVSYSSIFFLTQWWFITAQWFIVVFVVFNCCHFQDECKRLFWFPITSEVLVWAITLSLLSKLMISSENLLLCYMLQVCYCIHFLSRYNSIICFIN